MLTMTDFDTIFRKYHHRLFLYTLKFVDDTSEALDIVQNVFGCEAFIPYIFRKIQKPGHHLAGA